jgi:hypothetical protein
MCCISYVALNGSMIVNDELESNWEECNVAYLQVLSQQLSGGTEEERIEPQDGLPPGRFEIETPRV